jgi:C-terminal peptidase (prc)
MIRKSRALLIGAVAAWFVAMVAFAGGWYAARTFGDRMSMFAFIGSTFAKREALNSTPRNLRDEFELFWDVWALVDSEFYSTETVSDQKRVYGAISGMLASLGDNYTSFQEPDIAAQTRETMRGSLEGIGAYIRAEQGVVMIDRPIKNSPAARAGLLPDDILVAIDGVLVSDLIAGLSDGEASSKVASTIRGEKGTIVRLTVRRPPSETTFDIEVERDSVALESAITQVLDGDLLYIHITDFKGNTSEELDKQLRELLPSFTPKGVVLDLRNNPGGYIETAQKILGHFYDGVAFYEKTKASDLTEFKTISADQDVRMFDLPLVVLVNSGSASSSEIVAGALRDLRPNTYLVGETSFGKGTVQNIHTLRDGSSARITIAEWLTPNQSQIHKLGITPEQFVPFDSDVRYAVPCLGEQQPAPGFENCSDSQLYWGMRILIDNELPPTTEPASAPAE